VTKNVYFDTNAHLDIFEQRRPDLFAKISELVEHSAITVVSSEVGFTEALEGSHLATFAAGISRFFSVHPKWIYLTGMTARDVIFAYDPSFLTPDGKPGQLLEWGELLPRITEPTDIVNFPGLETPTSEAIQAYWPHDVIRPRMNYWREQLKTRQAGLQNLLRKEPADEVFRRLVASVLRVSANEATPFANELLGNGDIAPAFRTQFALDVLTADTTKPRELKNDFFDFLHAGVLPHIDIFVTRDEGFVERLKWYDATVREPQKLSPYTEKVCSNWTEFDKVVS